MKKLYIINKDNPTPAMGYFDIPLKDENGQPIYDGDKIRAKRFSVGTGSLEPATATKLGGIKVGTGLEIDENGVLSIPNSSNVISNPAVTYDTAVSGKQITFHVSSTTTLTNAHITKFICNLTGCDEQTINATDNAADVTFTVPILDNGTIIVFSCVAYDNFGGNSATSYFNVEVKNIGIVTPEISVNLQNGYVGQNATITVNNQFEIVEIEGENISDTLDHIVYTVRNENNAVVWTTNSTEYSANVGVNLIENTTYTFEAQFVGHVASSAVTSIEESTPEAFYTIDIPTVTLNASERGLPETLVATTSAFVCRTFTGALSTDETHVATTWMLYENDSVVWTSYEDAENLTSVTCGYTLKPSKTYRMVARYHGSLGHASLIGDEIGTTPDVFAIVNPTTVSVDYNDNNDYYCGLDLTVHTTEFSAVDDTHAATDYKICSDANGENVLASAIASSDLTSHTFNAALMGTVGAGLVYVFARHKGVTTGYSAPWSDAVAITLKAPVVDTPSVTSPAVNAEQYYGQTMTVTMSVHHVTGGSSIEGTGNWKICSDADGNNALVNGTFSAGTSFDISIEDLTTAGAGARYLFVQKNDNTYGLSEWSTGVVITIKQPVISTPVINSPSAGTSIAIGQTLSVTWDNVTTEGGTGDVTYTVKVCANNSDSETGLLSKTSTSPSVTFTKTEVETLTEGTYYIFAQATWSYGDSEWSSSQTITIIVDPDAAILAGSNFSSLSVDDLPGLKSGTLQQTASGRLIYRHSNNKGSVLVFNRFGKTEAVFCADAQYRYDGLTMDRSGDIGGIPNLYNQTNAAVYDVNTQSYATLPANTDSAIQTKWPDLAQELTARTQCDLYTTNAAGVNYTRGLTSIFTDGCDVPLFYHLLVFYSEGDYIDALDPTLSSYSTMACGLYGSNGARWFYAANTHDVWSCTEASYQFGLIINYGGCSGWMRAGWTGPIIPIRELL